MFRPREYQRDIAQSALSSNTLVVLPTGLGKTVIAFLVAEKRLKEHETGKVVFLAPTKPLAAQHEGALHELFHVGREESTVLTGEVEADRRAHRWRLARFVFATPETILIDAKEGRVDFADVVLLVFDEAQRSVRNYPYREIARIYRTQALRPLILGLTASPGGSRERIEETVRNLYIQNVEGRTETDSSLKTHVLATTVETIAVPIPAEYGRLLAALNEVLRERTRRLRRAGFLRQEPPTMRTLLNARGPIAARLKATKGSGADLSELLDVQAQGVVILHGIQVLETQGIVVFLKYVQNLKKRPQATLQDDGWRAVEKLARRIRPVGYPKLERLTRVVKEQLGARKDSRIIVFTQYRDSVGMIVETLAKAGVTAAAFVGQKRRAGKEGMSQGEQVIAIQRFRSGRFRVLVSSSIGEEGIHVPDVDLVVFYEAIPSEIRSIQRRGRTGRTRPGRVVVLLAKGTVDEVYYRNSLERETAMKTLVSARLKKQPR